MIAKTIERLRNGEWLDAGRVRGYLVLFAALNLAVIAFLLATSNGGVDRNGFLLGTDFLSFWSEGKLLAAGGAPYDSAGHIALQREWYASASGYTAFFYPPQFLPVVRPIGALSYFPALAAWLAFTAGAFVAALRLWTRALPWLRLLLAVAAFPATLLVITHGQTSFLVAALLGGGAALQADGRKGWAGVLFGLATIKPQFGLLVPVALIAARQWRTIGAGALTVAALAASATALYGIEIWPQWLAAASTAQAALAGGAIGFAKLVSPFAALRLAGANVAAAYAGQAAVTVAVAGALALAAWRRGFTRAMGAAMLAGASLATPFALDYDLVLLAFPLVMLTRGVRRPWETTIAALVFALPAFARPLALTAGLQIAPLVLGAFFIVLARRALTDVPENEKGAA